MCCTFYRKVLVTIFNLGYIWYLVKDFLYNQSTIADWSEDVKQDKTMNLSVLKSSACEPCLQSETLRCTLTFFHFLYISKENSYLTLKRLGERGGHLDSPPPCGFLKYLSSKERVKPWYFATFNIIISHIFSENFIEVPQVSLLKRDWWRQNDWWCQHFVIFNIL